MENLLYFLDENLIKILDKTDKAILLQYKTTLKNIKKNLGEKYLTFAVDNILTFNEMSKYNRLKILDTELMNEIKEMYRLNKNTLSKELRNIYKENFYGNIYAIERTLPKFIKINKLKGINILIENKIIDWKQTTLKNANYLNDNVKRSIYQGLVQGEGYNVISKRIEHEFKKGMSQSLLTTQTEGNRVLNKARLDSMNALPKELGAKKQWISTLDYKTRSSHRSADNQIVGIDEPFTINGELLMYPLDPAGSAKNTIRCRCTMITYFDDLTYTSRKDNITKKEINMTDYQNWLKNKF